MKITHDASSFLSLFYVTSLLPPMAGNGEKKAREKISEGGLNGEGIEKEDEQRVSQKTVKKFEEGDVSFFVRKKGRALQSRAYKREMSFFHDEEEKVIEIEGQK